MNMPGQFFVNQTPEWDQENKPRKLHNAIVYDQGRALEKPIMKMINRYLKRDSKKSKRKRKRKKSTASWIDDYYEDTSSD